MNRHIGTAAILVAAIALYGAGSTAGGSILLFAGVAVELWFWARVLRLGQLRKSSQAAARLR
jgi:hypothetical protein